MAAGVSDIVEVVVLAARANALLAGGGHVVRALFAAEKHVLELIHTGIDEKQRRVLSRNQRGALDDSVAAFRKELEESPADFITVHKSSVLFPLEWRPHRIQDDAKPEKDEPHLAIGVERAISNRSF